MDLIHTNYFNYRYYYYISYLNYTWKINMKVSSIMI